MKILFSLLFYVLLRGRKDRRTVWDKMTRAPPKEPGVRRAQRERRAPQQEAGATLVVGGGVAAGGGFWLLLNVF